jgi:hypothetical protein
VVKVPSLTVKLPLVKKPRPRSDVPLVSGTVPVPIAAALTTGGVALEAAALDEDEADEAVELVDDDAVEVVDAGFSAPCTAAESAVLTRSKAVWLAILARPVVSVLDAPNIWSMTVELSVCAWVTC